MKSHRPVYNILLERWQDIDDNFQVWKWQFPPAPDEIVSQGYCNIQTALLILLQLKENTTLPLATILEEKFQILEINLEIIEKLEKL